MLVSDNSGARIVECIRVLGRTGRTVGSVGDLAVVSVKELRKRLIKRGRDTNKEINLRLSYALDEIKHYNEYSYVLINQNIHTTTS